jgi:hypothetical protein
MQGRYLLPLLGLGGLFVAAAASAVGARLRGPVIGAWLGGLLVYQLGALALNLSRFYA